MAKKTKENDEKIVKKTASKTATKKVAAKKEPKKVLNKTNKKAPSTKKTVAKKADNKIKKVEKNIESKKAKENEKSKKATKAVKSEKTVKAKKDVKPVEKKVTTTKSSASKEPKVKQEKSTTKKAVKEKEEKLKASTTKKSVKKVSKTDKTAKETKKAKTTKTQKSSAKTVKKKNQKKNISVNPLEYYDLPYRYNQTLVKVLAQNPNTLFVYWDISDQDRLNFQNKYGNDFFDKTRPVLVVHNVTNNYTFEININDFANNWYVNVDDTKCKYQVELGRRPNYYESKTIPVDYLNVAFSNTIEIPNDHILFFKENDKIYFKNIKTNKITEKVFKKKTYSKNLKELYKNYNLSMENDRFDFNNPSSQNPTSSLL